MSGPWEQFASGGAQPPFSVSTTDQAAQVYGQGGMSKQQLEAISQDMFKRGTGGTGAFKAPAAAPWKKFSSNQHDTSAHAGSPLATAKTFAGNLGSDMRDFADMFAGAPAMAVKAAVESAVSAYKRDPRAGVQAGQELASNPYFAPWLHPLLSAQAGLTGQQPKESEFNHLLDTVFGKAENAAKAAGKKAGVPEAATQIIVDDVMSTLGLKGLHGIAKGAVDLATREAKPAAAKAAPPEPTPIEPPQETAPVHPPEAPVPLHERLQPYQDAALNAHAQDILDGKVSAAKADAALKKSPALMEAVKRTAARRAEAREGLAGTPEEAAPQPKAPETFPPDESVVKTHLTNALEIGPKGAPEMPALDRAVAKVKAGKRFDMTSEERIAWNDAQKGGNKIVPADGYKSVRGQSGAIHPDVLKKLGVMAGGALLFNYLDPQDKWKSYATGAALGLAGAWLAPRVKEGLAADSRVRIDKYANDFEAASQLAEVRLHQQVGAIRKALPNAEDRAAVTRAIDEGKPAATPEQAKVQAAVKQFFSDVGRLAQEHGVLKELRDNYVTHLWDNPVNRSRFGSALTTTSPFTKARTFTTLAEGKAAGLVPRTEDISDIMEAYGRSMNRAMQGKTFIGTLKGLKAPDGRPLIAKADAAPKGYVPVDLPQLRGSLVHPDIAQSLSMFESGRLHGPLEGVSEGMQALKRIKVMGSLFHIKSLAEAGIGSTPVTKWGALPKRIAGFALGRDEMLKQLNEGGMSQDATDLLRHGINISLERGTPGVEDIGGSFYQGMTNLQQYLDANLPQAGKVSKAFTELNHKLDTITWGRVHTGLKLMVGSETMHRLERNGVPREQAAETAANFVNTQFGGLNWRRIAEGARSRWGRDFSLAMLHPKARTVSQILLFAPDWTISTIRQYTQAIRRSGGPLEQAKGLLKPTELADLHRLALLRGAMYYLAVGDAVNYMLSGHHLWQNKNPLRVDLGNGQTMQFSKHLTEPLEWVHAPAKTAAGKLSYMVTEPIDQLTGKEYIGGPPMQENPIVHAAEGLLPFPATSGGPAQAVAGMAGFPIYGHTPEQMREIARERRERKNTPEARAHRRKLREERRNY